MTITDTKIRNTRPGKKPIKLRAGNGLILEVRPNGAKLWRYRYRIAGKENMFALGNYCQAPAGESDIDASIRRASGLFTLAEARQERDRCRGLVKQGIHPAHSRQALRSARVAENANTFESVALEWIEKKTPNWSSYYARQVNNILKADVFPYIGTLPIRNVSAAHIREILVRAGKRDAKTIALLIRQWSSAIFCHAVATQRADGDPAMALKGLIERKKIQHRKPLTRDQIRLLLKNLDEFGGYRATVIAMRLALLTFVRPGELRAANWAEFSLDRAEWRIPAERMKMRETHIVPLSKQAITLLRELHELTGYRDFLFPNHRRPKDCMTATTLNRALERMGFNGKDSIGFSAHGFRATASTMLNEMGYRSDVIERQLAHKERNKTRASYNQAEYLAERTLMMQQWADHLDHIKSGADVIPLRGKAV